MTKTIEQMTIAELMGAIRLKKRLAKRAPKLRKERSKILVRLEEIDRLLAGAGPSRGRPSKEAAPIRALPAGRGKSALSRILEFLRSKGGAAPRATEIAEALNLNINTVRPTLSRLAKLGKVETDQGVYWVEGAQSAKAPAKKTRAGRRGGSVKQRVLDFLDKTKDLHKTTEIRKALPGVKPQYIYNLLGILKKDGLITHENGMWGMKLPF